MASGILNKKNIVTYSLPIILSTISYFGMGFDSDYWKIIISAILIHVASKNKLTLCLSLLSLFTLSFYFYTGFIFGRPNIGYIASLFETNKLEAIEFLSRMTFKHIAIYIVFYTSLFSYYYINIKNKNNHPYISLITCIPLIYASPFYSFSKETTKTIIHYKKNCDEFIQATNNAPSWIINENKNIDKDVIVIIGESVRKDFMSLYGFKHKNTPFLESVNGNFINGYVSAAPNTSPSLQRTLASFKNDTLKEENNVVSLANTAGYDTIWISNQGFVGKFDTPVTRIALRSKQQFFLKEGNSSSKNTDDFELASILDSVMKKNKKRKVIFIHMMGSHPTTCERLQGFPVVEYGNSKDIDCYIATISKLDTFIKKVKNILDNGKRDYSIVYFSDHGLTIREGGIPDVGSTYKQNYEIPFFIINKNDIKHNMINKNISAYSFINIYESILGIKTNSDAEHFNLDDIDSNNDIEVYNWHEMIKLKSLNNQPANDIVK